MPYNHSLAKAFRIWFSPKDDEFLPFVNQLRFIQMRQANPDCELFFIYDQRRLNDGAMNALHTFCANHDIQPLDFASDITPLISDEVECELISLAELELEHPGGNMAAASDLTRILIPVLEQFGIYVDFDVPFNTQALIMPSPDSMDVAADRAFYFPRYGEEHYSNCFLSASYTEQGFVTTDALDHIHYIQTKIIERYKLGPKYIFEIEDARTRYDLDIIKGLIDEGGPKTIMDLRVLVLNNKGLERREKRYFIEDSVYFFSATQAYYTFEPYVERISPMASLYNDLADDDNSWLPSRKPKIDRIKAKYHKRAKLIQNAWRAYKARDKKDTASLESSQILRFPISKCG